MTAYAVATLPDGRQSQAMATWSPPQQPSRPKVPAERSRR